MNADAVAIPGMDDPPDESVVRALVDLFGRSEAIVRRWSRAKAKVTLDGLRREAALISHRSATRAGADEAGLTKPRPVMDAARIDAADWLEQAINRGSVETALALSYAVLDMQDDEQRKLAEWMVKKFRGEK